jgi:amino acid transporter
MPDTSAPHDDSSVIEAGYKPQLKRGLHFFASFSVAFSCMSVLTGVFANYGFVLQKAGPFGMWSWWLVVLGHTLVALVYAEMTGRMALAGSAYNWNTRLSRPFVGWMTGWMYVWLQFIAGASVNITIIPILQTLLGVQYTSLQSKAICICMILIQALINVHGVRLASRINLISVIIEMTALLGFGLLIGSIVAFQGHAHLSLLTSVPHGDTNYWQPFLMACLLGVWTMIGFEGAAEMGEETANVHHVSPRGVFSSVLVAGILGFILLFSLTIAIPDLKAITASADPIGDITRSVIGVPLTNIFLILVLISIFACALVCNTTGARMVWAMSRDKKFPAHKFFSKVSSRQVPAAAVWLVSIVGIICVLFADTATALYASGAVMGILAYLLTVLSFVFGNKKIPKKGAFTLGIWHWPVVILATAWLIIEVAILTVPEEFHSVAWTTGGILIAGGIVYRLFCRQKKSS